MKLRVFVFGLVWAFCLFGQQKKKGFDFVEACFRNPRLPYCIQRDFVNKPAPKNGVAPTYSTTGNTGSTIDAAGIDWRFADPSADALAVLDCSNLSATPLAHSLIDQLGSSQGLVAAEVQNVFRALTGVNRVALSVHEDKILLFITGRAPDSVLPAPDSGWKAVPLAGNTVLIGPADAVDQAQRRLLIVDSALGELALRAQARPGDTEFWTAGSAAGKDAAGAGVKRFESTASMRDGLASDSVFEFDAAPDAIAIQTWMSTLGDAKIEGNAVFASMSVAAEEIQRNANQIALSPLGQRLSVIIRSARYLPVRDSATTVHTKPVIFGLDGGPREVK